MLINVSSISTKFTENKITVTVEISEQMFDMAPILLYHALKATTPFVDASVNKRLRQFLPSINDCLLQYGDRREASMFVNIYKGKRLGCSNL